MALSSTIRLLLVVLVAACAQAAVYSGLSVQAVQPDGSKLATKIYGDEFYAVTESQGYTVVRDPASRALCYARLVAGDLVSTGVWAGRGDPVALGLPPRLRPALAVAQAKSLARRQYLGVENGFGHRLRAEMRAQQAARDVGAVDSPPSHTTIGSVVGLALMVDFSDVPGDAAQLSEIDGLFNTLGYSGYGNSGSVRQYYEEVSKGKLTFTNVVGNRAFIRLPKTKEWYNYIDGDRAKGFRDGGDSGVMLVSDALAVLNALSDSDRMSQYGVDFNSLTSWSDGTIKAVSVLYAGETSGSWSEGLWPHMMPAEANAISIPLTGNGAGKILRTYQISDLSTSLTIGTICHECGHMVCDFPDLYDYGGQTNGVGMFCLMDAGSYGNDGKTPIKVSGYLRYMAGWYDESDIVDLGALGVKGWGLKSIGVNGMYLYGRGGAMKARPSEFFLIENRILTGWDAYLPTSGMALWHIDMLSSNSTDSSAFRGHNEAQLVQADGRDDLFNAVNYGDQTDLFPSGAATGFGGSSTPASTWWSGAQSGLIVTEIGQPGTSMTFRVGTPEPYFIEHPKDTFGRAGKVVRFTVVVASDPSAALSWETKAADGQVWTVVPAANTEQISITAKDTDVGASFRCLATNSYGTTTSNSARLIYEPPPTPNVAPVITPGAVGHAIPPPVAALQGGGGDSGCGLGSGIGMVGLFALLLLRIGLGRTCFRRAE